jgi:ACS family hexuronate transporter-like MFS transporter
VKPIKHLRWWIVWTLFFSTVINYIDRQTLSVLAPVITKEFHMSHGDYSHIVSAFQVAYAGMWLIGGVLIDIIGTRLGLTLAMIWWSLASMLPASARSVFQFSLFRFMLGVGEGCNWPGASKTVAEWFPAKERGVAVAIFDSGSSVGAVIAPPLVAFLAYHFGWRFAFLTAGSLVVSGSCSGSASTVRSPATRGSARRNGRSSGQAKTSNRPRAVKARRVGLACSLSQTSGESFSAAR